jgi:hypothetical protein
MIAISPEARQQWTSWALSNVAPPFRKRALKAALKTLASGATAEQAIVAAKQAEASRANYMATSALVLGAISAAVVFRSGGLSLLTILFTIASAVQGRLSLTRAWQAWTGLALALCALLLFVLGLVLRYVVGVK